MVVRPAVDGDGRDRWNVHPLLGAPMDALTQDDDGRQVLADDAELRTPPLLFANAPAVAFAAADG